MIEFAAGAVIGALVGAWFGYLKCDSRWSRFFEETLRKQMEQLAMVERRLGELAAARQIAALKAKYLALGKRGATHVPKDGGQPDLPVGPRMDGSAV